MISHIIDKLLQHARNTTLNYFITLKGITTFKDYEIERGIRYSIGRDAEINKAYSLSRFLDLTDPTFSTPRSPLERCELLLNEIALKSSAVPPSIPTDQAPILIKNVNKIIKLLLSLGATPVTDEQREVLRTIVAGHFIKSPDFLNTPLTGQPQQAIEALLPADVWGVVADYIHTQEPPTVYGPLDRSETIALQAVDHERLQIEEQKRLEKHWLNPDGAQ